MKAPNGSDGAAPRPARREITRDMLPQLYEVGEKSISLNRLDEAAWCFERAAGFDPAATRPLKGLAQTRHLQGRAEEARQLIESAIAAGDRSAESHTILGQICQSQGDFAAARAAFEAAVAADPLHGAAHLRIALLGPAANPARHAGELEQLAASPALTTDQRATLGFALGREYETAGEHERAFAAYRSANEVRRRQYPGYSNGFTSADRMISTFTPDFLRKHAGLGDNSQRPVFIVGMMRSGTTLVEQILSSHADVHGHGELSTIRVIAHAIAAGATDGAFYPECLHRLPPQAIAHHAGQYLAALEREAPQARRNIDKLPHNFEHLGLIALMFPNARVIHCVRDPVDTCVSNYFQDFGAFNPFTYDLALLGQYHHEYDRLMAHWHAVLTLPILRIPYEEMVADQEACSRRAVAFLDLPWDPACLDFHKNKRPVYTKSLWQVRQPIYPTAIGRWRPYARHLEPLFAALQMTLRTPD